VTATGFEAFADDALPRLRRALVGHVGPDTAADAAAEAMAYAWEHWEEVRMMQNPIGYLYRVGQSRSRGRKQGLLPAPDQVAIPDVEPGLVAALDALAPRQRTAVWLIHACQWLPGEVAEALGISASAVATHATRGLAHLRDALEVARADV
jgi:DNA-directed RNA polymerase specialized sigma24 family protein